MLELGFLWLVANGRFLVFSPLMWIFNLGKSRTDLSQENEKFEESQGCLTLLPNVMRRFKRTRSRILATFSSLSFRLSPWVFHDTLSVPVLLKLLSHMPEAKYPGTTFVTHYQEELEKTIEEKIPRNNYLVVRAQIY
ncbi:hypothetical protein NPIL_149051 [Nephila pilipes]|uniref:Uncharacterized protein n=1 Tax=Nephila pilipes TaxID=299642 RepID=A0A8X6UNF7_NEPPI|nr:hypothetical protein NPIL_149051 [Nephila pilipes]